MSNMNMKAVQRQPPSSALPSPPNTDQIRVLVGPEEQEFTLSRKTLTSASPFFRSHLTTSPSQTLRLPTTLPSTFELFTLHLHHPRTFATFISTSIATLDPETCHLPDNLACSSRLSLHWTLVHLHLFGASISLPSLQDAAMDAIQDLYLHYDWEVNPSFIRFLYAADPVSARRLRKWAVAMVAWSIALSAHVSDDWQELLNECAEFRREYNSHLSKMAGIRSRGVDVRVKNPQLRLPRNGLRSEERYFGFRLCSFHSHRGVVGEGTCLHARSDGPDVEGWYDVVDLERELAEMPVPPRERTAGEKDKAVIRKAVSKPELKSAMKPTVFRGVVKSASKPEIRTEATSTGLTEGGGTAERRKEGDGSKRSPKQEKDRLMPPKEEDEEKPELPRKNSLVPPAAKIELKLSLEDLLGAPSDDGRTGQPAPPPSERRPTLPDANGLEVRPEPPRKNSVVPPSPIEPEQEKQKPHPPKKGTHTVTPERGLSPVPKDTLSPPKERERKPSPVSMLILDGFYLDVS